MKVKICPKCGFNELGDRWCVDRKLQQYCQEEDCDWVGEPRTPEKRVIKTEKIIDVDYAGWVFEIYDKYGYIATISRSYDSRIRAIEELEKELISKNKNKNYAPCTGLIWPARVEVKAEKFIIKNGKFHSTYFD